MIKKKKLSNSRGFSFVELIVVIALVGLLSAIGLPSLLRSLPEKRLKNAARSLYADLQKARLQAVKENAMAFVQFTPADGSYALYVDEDGDKSLDITVDRLVMQVGLNDYGAVQYGCNATNLNNWREPAATDVPNTTIPTSGVTDNNITFTTLGVANTEDIYLQDDNVQEVCYAVTVSMLGLVRILRYNGSSWE
ncbi:GspH/FimT family pseudopilin [Desulfobulbus sp. TB]|nr:GspH/FimT family pseudopilin [Desulfobulbus sp. TB]